MVSPAICDHFNLGLQGLQVSFIWFRHAQPEPTVLFYLNCTPVSPKGCRSCARAGWMASTTVRIRFYSKPMEESSQHESAALVRDTLRRFLIFNCGNQGATCRRKKKQGTTCRRKKKHVRSDIYTYVTGKEYIYICTMDLYVLFERLHVERILLKLYLFLENPY